MLADTVDQERATTSVTIGLPVRDLDAARAWYERVLGKVADIEPVPGILEFEVHPGSWLQLHDGDRTVFRIGVKDVEAARDRLATMGIFVAPIERVEGVIAFFEFSDPDGNHLSLYQVLE
jgi:predicted enzyme related to lactoylglutathione lyase